MRNVQDNFETYKRSFISAFSIGMTVPLKIVSGISNICVSFPQIFSHASLRGWFQSHATVHMHVQRLAGGYHVMYEKNLFLPVYFNKYHVEDEEMKPIFLHTISSGVYLHWSITDVKLAFIQ